MKFNLKHKFHAKPTECDGIRFPSKLEAKCYAHLKMLQKAGEVLFFLRQVSFDLPGSSTHKIDYCVFLPEVLIFIEVKGKDLPMGRLKRKQVKDIYPINIHVVTSVGELDEAVRSYREKIR